MVKFLEDQLSRKKAKGHPNTSQESCVDISQVDMVPQISIRDPLLPTNTKGRPKNANRIKYSLEMVKKKRTCSRCGGLGHYISGCSIKKSNVLFYKLLDR